MRGRRDGGTQGKSKMAKGDHQDAGQDAGEDIRVADVFRLTLTAPRRLQIIAALSGGSFGYSCKPKLAKGEDGRYSTMVFVRGDRLPALSAELGLRHGVEIAEICNFSAQLRAIPPEVYELV
jgi:hypothetical protein